MHCTYTTKALVLRTPAPNQPFPAHKRRRSSQIPHLGIGGPLQMRPIPVGALLVPQHRALDPRERRRVQNPGGLPRRPARGAAALRLHQHLVLSASTSASRVLSSDSRTSPPRRFLQGTEPLSAVSPAERRRACIGRVRGASSDALSRCGKSECLP